MIKTLFGMLVSLVGTVTLIVTGGLLVSFLWNSCIVDFPKMPPIVGLVLFAALLAVYLPKYHERE